MLKTKINTTTNQVPIWFDKNIETNPASEEERQEIEELLKEYR